MPPNRTSLAPDSCPMSSTSEPITQIQSHLEEDLHFLKRRLPSKHYQRTNSPLKARLLDIVALFLATGESSPTLATFWWEKEAKLYIAKSPPSDSQNDAIIAKAFFDDLRHAQGFESMIPFLATYSQASVNKRIRHLRDSLQISLNMARRIFDESDDTEDPLNRLKDILTFQPPFAFDDSENAMSTFKELVVISRRVLDAHDSAFSSRFYDASACRLQRHLDKMAQYLRVGVLIKFWKKRGKYIDITWVPAIGLGGTARTLKMGTIMSRYSTVISGEFAASPEELRDYIMWVSEPMRSITITPHVHAEVSLILYVSENVGLRLLQDEFELLIGSNKTSCLACTYWRREFNSALGTNWETTCTYGQFAYETMWKIISSNCVPRSDWSIPCDDNGLPLCGIDLATLRRCYEAVLTCVQSEVKVLFDKELAAADERIYHMRF